MRWSSCRDPEDDSPQSGRQLGVRDCPGFGSPGKESIGYPLRGDVVGQARVFGQQKDPGRRNLPGLRIVESARSLDAAVERAAAARGGHRIGARPSSHVRERSSDRGGGLQVAGEGDRDRIAGAVERERRAPCIGPPSSFCLNETQRPDPRLAMVAQQFNRLINKLLAMLGSCILVASSQLPQHLLVVPQNSSIGPYWRR